MKASSSKSVLIRDNSCFNLVLSLSEKHKINFLVTFRNEPRYRGSDSRQIPKMKRDSRVDGRITTHSHGK